MANANEDPALRRRPLGRTGLMVGEIGFGAWAIGGGACVKGLGLGYGATDDAESLAALARAFDLGVNFVDTADAYGMGRSETLVGKAIRASPCRIHVATKVGTVRQDPAPMRKDFSADYIRRACDRSLSRLGVTCLDLYQLHNPAREVIADERVWNTLRELKDKGRIAHYGISALSPEDGLLAIEKGEAETVQIPYHLLDARAAATLFPAAEKHGVGIIVREPLANGLLTGKYGPDHVFPDDDYRHSAYARGKLAAALKRVEALRFLATPGRSLAQAALKFALAPAAVSVVIPGAKTPKQVEENVAAAAAPDLTPEERQCSVGSAQCSVDGPTCLAAVPRTLNTHH
jgi:aryl-alcohol dehydrogenase-like predicted oxidoreductase